MAATLLFAGMSLGLRAIFVVLFATKLIAGLSGARVRVAGQCPVVVRPLLSSAKKEIVDDRFNIESECADRLDDTIRIDDRASEPIIA